ncbi:MAG: HNH endonuclease [Muribaculaceae bacterium]|nr:HNH endonuclease [Muribaculaceae bacterium]
MIEKFRASIPSLHACTPLNIIPSMLSQESKLYTTLPVAEKYAILEAMRLELDRLYRDDLPTYDRYRASLRQNTWDALEENWKLWDPVPKSHVVWEGPDDCTCRLKPSHPNFKECDAVNFTVCQYDLHGSPNFDAVTFPGSIVDISDLYDELSSDNIRKRGGSPYSLQEIAQECMARNLEATITEWAKANGREPDFWQWRDTLDLVPHEDTDCRTMRLVYRPAHTAFKHRGGVANALNIKSHFSNS